MESITVESYAGYKTEERPLRFSIGKRNIEIISVEKRWLTPECRCFKVMGNDDYLYDLEYNIDKDKWSLLTINKR